MLRKKRRHQPDFVADLNFFVGEGFGGHGGAERLARKGNRYREESQFWIFIGELGKPSARLFPQAKHKDALQRLWFEAHSTIPKGCDNFWTRFEALLIAALMIGVEKVPRRDKCSRIELLFPDRTKHSANFFVE